MINEAVVKQDRLIEKCIEITSTALGENEFIKFIWQLWMPLE